jgi:hypothetical protein
VEGIEGIGLGDGDGDGNGDGDGDGKGDTAGGGVEIGCSGLGLIPPLGGRSGSGGGTITAGG